MPRQYVTVCDTQYGKGAFSRRWTELVSSYEPGLRVEGGDAEFLLDVCGRFDRYARIMSRGKVYFKVVNKVFNGKRVKGVVMITPNSGHEVWIGKSQIINKMFPRGTLPDPSHINRKQALQALRSIIEPQIKEFRRANLERLRGGLYHIDHVYPFKLLVEGWCRENQIDLETLSVKCRGVTCRLASTDLAESWFDYHALNARLQVLDASENIRKGARYYGGG